MKLIKTRKILYKWYVFFYEGQLLNFILQIKQGAFFRNAN